MTKTLNQIAEECAEELFSMPGDSCMDEKAHVPIVLAALKQAQAQIIAENERLRNALTFERDLMLNGCGNHGCRNQVPRGQATNGPCHCGRRTGARRIDDALRSEGERGKVE